MLLLFRKKHKAPSGELYNIASLETPLFATSAFVVASLGFGEGDGGGDEDMVLLVKATVKMTVIRATGEADG